MASHGVGNPNFEMLNAAKNLRAHAGVLSALTIPTPKAPESPATPTRLEVLRTRGERRRSPRKRGRQMNRAALTT